MIHALPTDEFLSAVQDFDRHARLGRWQALGNSCRKGALPKDHPWNPLRLDAQASRRSGGQAFVRMGLYAALGAPESALALCQDLYEFAHELNEAGNERGACFLAIFAGQAIGSEVHFDHLLWRQLQTMHGVDAQYFDGSTPPSTDAANVNFSFGGRAYVVAGRHQGAGALPRPCLVFKPKPQARS